MDGDRQRILRQVGIALIAFGVLDLAAMVYCILNRINYASSFNIFAVITGVVSECGQTDARPWMPFVLGAVASVVVAALVGTIMHSDAARTATTLAHAKVGSGYRLWISNLSFAVNHGHAQVVAYDATSIKTVDVDW